MSSTIRCVFVIQRRIVKWIKKHRALPPEARFLELGCGRGAGAALLLKIFQPRTLAAMDLDPRMIFTACRYLAPDQKNMLQLFLSRMIIPIRNIGCFIY